MQKANGKQANSPVASRAPPALDPERVGLTQPYKDFVSKGWIIKITLEILPSGTSCKCELGGQVDVPEGQSRKDLGPGQAKQLIIDSGLWSPGQRGKKSGSGKNETELPKRSLCVKDFEGTTDAKLLARIQSVAKEIGSEKAKGRIGSLRLMIAGSDTFDKWWTAASSEDKVRLLTDKKQYDQLQAAFRARVGVVCSQCPFQGTVPTPAPKEGEEEEEQDEEEEEPRQRPSRRNSPQK